MAENQAIETLEMRRRDLIEGMYSISRQKEDLEKLRQTVKTSERNLAQDKKTLIQIDEALAILKAGED